MAGIYDFSLKTLEGGPLDLADHRGKVMLLVNTASKCGFTPQYQGLQALHARYQARGLVVIGFPCNQFGAQEPGGAEEIGHFCEKNFGVTFPVSEKIDVNGPAAAPLYRYLQTAAPGIFGSRRIKWNFTKFLVDREGRVVARFAPLTPPEKLATEVERLL
ncbi:MAG: glutathione peroxidase [Proteobacteria bacterium]|nr:glutathione peroxidase [Pseudomonadota bacterium]HQR03296.1 glutathione peroxidase [Rhodocyclaceae bacterium]